MRKTLIWNDDWTFTMDGKEAMEVTLPHTWNGTDGQDGGNDYKRCKCIYKKKFEKPKMAGGDTCLIVFRGVNSEAKVLINGTQIALHEGGYSTFGADMTPFLKEDNVLEVEVGNEINGRVYPQKADFTFYGGIYRDVELIIMSENHIEFGEMWSPELKINVLVKRNIGIASVQMKSTGSGTVRLRLIDADNKCEEEKVMPAGVINADLTVEDVHLWDGLKDPYLYKVEAELLIDGDVVDKASSFIGFRTFSVDPEEGFLLNGKPYNLHGVCRHQDRPKIGNAISKAEHDEDMELIREVGANTIRLAHYQHDQYFYDLCDKYGMIVWAEIPYISEHMPGGRENTISQMKELILQNYNHPSIVTWGLSNEITIVNRHKADMLDNHKVLNDLCHELDPKRFTSLACFAMCNPFSRVVHISDVVSYNLYLGWYVPGMFLNDVFLKLFHKKYPARCIGYSEYGAEAMTNLHSEKPHRGDHTEEYQAIYHEYMLECFKRHPFMWATHVWNMFDFAADARNQGGEPGMNHKGLVTFDRKIKKDSFYLYKAYWNEEPMVHICSKRFKERKASSTTIKVYSNLPEVTLYQNGDKLETKKGDKVFTFKVELKMGDNQFEASAGKVKDTVTFSRKDNPESYKLKKNKAKSANWV